MKFIVIYTLSLFIVITSCKSHKSIDFFEQQECLTSSNLVKQITDSLDHYSFSIPDGWFYSINSIDHDGNKVIVGKSDENTSESIIVTANERTDTADYQFDFKSELAILKREGHKVVDYGETEIDNKKAYWTLEINKEEEFKVTLNVYQENLLNNSYYVYGLSLTDYDNYEDIICQHISILNSFKYE